MSKGKLQKFAEVQTFNNVLQPSFEDVFNKDYRLKGKWKENFFCNNNPIVLELGCGKGEYTVNLAGLFPEKNFIGVDIKGARIWKGAKSAIQQSRKNVAFIRTRIDFITSLFTKDEIEEIWITFPDPQPKKAHKRLTSSRFLERYQAVLKQGGTVNLKTDDDALYFYTLDLVKFNGLCIHAHTEDVYNSQYADNTLSIKTFYEQMWLKEGLTIKYIKFELPPNGNQIKELPPDDDIQG